MWQRKWMKPSIAAHQALSRQEEETPYTTFSEFAEATGGDPFGTSRYEYLEHIQVDGTPEGFFELVVLTIQAEQFYLQWHANYNDLTVVCSHEAVEAKVDATNDFGISLSSEQKQEALQLDIEPRVEFENETVRVRIVTFTKWGGFFEEIYTISQGFPHSILEHESQELVPYDCGVMF